MKYRVTTTFRGIEEGRTFKIGMVAEFSEKRAEVINRKFEGALVAIGPEPLVSEAPKAPKKKGGK